MTNQISKAREAFSTLKTAVANSRMPNRGEAALKEIEQLFDTLSTVDAGRLEKALDVYGKDFTPVSDTVATIIQAARTLHGIIGEKDNG